MSLTCVVCGKNIQVGELLLANPSGELAHQSCVDDHLRKPVVRIPSLQILSPKLTPPENKADAVAIQVVEPCLMPSVPRVCVVCGKPCIASCPCCHKLVCQDYGWSGANCSGRHESSCPEAAKQREPIRTASSTPVTKQKRSRTVRKPRARRSR